MLACSSAVAYDTCHYLQIRLSRWTIVLVPSVRMQEQFAEPLHGPDLSLSQGSASDGSGSAWHPVETRGVWCISPPFTMWSPPSFAMPGKDQSRPRDSARILFLHEQAEHRGKITSPVTFIHPSYDVTPWGLRRWYNS